MPRLSSLHKLLLLTTGLAAILLVFFAIWGESLDASWSLDGCITYFQTRGHLAGVFGIGLLISDLLLPIPVTGIVGALGAVLGPVWGFLYSWIGLVLAGLTGYSLARLGGRSLANRLTSPDEQERYREWFDRWGGLAVVISRMLPILPEVFSILAGLYGMQVQRFLLAVTLGSLAPAAVYAWLGAQLREHPGPAIWGLVFLTAGAWLLFLRISKTGSAEPPKKSGKVSR